MAYDNIRLETEGSAAVLTLNRPAKRNALSLALMHELIYALDECARNSAVRAIILAAEGRVFSSGHDLSEMSGRTEAEYSDLFEVCSSLMLKLHDVPQPVIAEVQGLATAAGCQLVAACDLAVASEQAGFATPGVRIGLFCSTPMGPLTRAIGRKRAMYMLLTGNVIDPRTAAKWGLVNSVVAPDELKAATRSLAARIAESSPYTIATGKSAFYHQVDVPERPAYEHTQCVMTQNATAEDAQEGISAFLEKRAPVWRGR